MCHRAGRILIDGEKSACAEMIHLVCVCVCMWWDGARRYLDIAACDASVCACYIYVYDVCNAVCQHRWLNASQEKDNLQDVTAALYRSGLRVLCRKWLIWEMCVSVQVRSRRKVQIQHVNQRYGSSRICVVERALRCTSIMHIFVCASTLPAGPRVFHVGVCVCARALLHLTVCMKEISPHSRAAPLIWKQPLRLAFICSAWIW